MRGARTLGLLLACAWLASPLHAQPRHHRAPPPRDRPHHSEPRVIVLDETRCLLGRPMVPTDWVVVPAAPAACESAALATACGLPAAEAGTCPSVEQVALGLSDAQLAACTPGLPLLAAAGELYADSIAEQGIARAYALYRRAADHAPVRHVALFRAGRAAIRLSRYDDAMEAFGLLFGAGPMPAALRTAAERWAAAYILAYDDLDEDQHADAEFPEARFRAPFLPDQPWARGLAIRAVHEMLALSMLEQAERARVAIRTRWPDVTDAELAAPPTVDWGDGDFDPTSVSRVVPMAALAACAPPAGATIEVRYTIAMSETSATVVAQPPGRTASCVADVIRAVHFTPPEGGAATREGLVLFVPSE